MVSTINKSIIKSSCFLYKSKSTNKIETEAIFGETFVVEHFEESWSYGYLKNDDYFGHNIKGLIYLKNDIFEEAKELFNISIVV